MAEILRIEFNHLPRVTRERLTAITQGKAGPSPIFQRRDGGSGIAGWVILFLLAGCAFVGLLLANYGDPYHATQPPLLIAFYGVFAFLCVVSVLGAVRGSLRKKALPFAPGSYLFALDTVILSEAGVKLLSQREITGIEPVHHLRNGSYTHTRIGVAYSNVTATLCTPSIRCLRRAWRVFRRARIPAARSLGACRTGRERLA